LKVAQRDQWIALLAKLVAPMNPEEAVIGLKGMLPLLADLPDGAFTLKSLEHVARECRRMPSYGELRSALSAWWIDNRPEMPAIEGPPGQGSHAFWEGRANAMRREWDDPAGIRERVRTCNGDEKFLGALRTLVGRWAPQHLAVVPPAPESFSKPAPLSVRPTVTSFPMTDEALLAEYERLEAQGNLAAATRATMLRKRLGVKA